MIENYQAWVYSVKQFMNLGLYVSMCRKRLLNVTLTKLFIGLVIVTLFFSVVASVWSKSSPQVRIDFVRFNQEMQKNYGPKRLETAQAWQTLLNGLKPLSDTEKLTRVNHFFHNHLVYRTDMQIWGVEDYWATPLETLGRGVADCEDYAISKYISLRHAGISDDKLRLIYVKAKIAGAQSSASEAHMVLGYYATPTSTPLILDSLMSVVKPASERKDLSPVFSFNSQGLWAGNKKANSSPTSRLSRWRTVLEGLAAQGIYLD